MTVQAMVLSRCGARCHEGEPTNKRTSWSCAMRWACSAAVGSGAPCGEALCALAASSTFIVDPMTLMLFIASAARASCAAA